MSKYRKQVHKTRTIRRMNRWLAAVPARRKHFSTADVETWKKYISETDRIDTFRDEVKILKELTKQ